MNLALWPHDQSKSHNHPLTIRHCPLLVRRIAIFSLWLSYFFFKDNKSRGNGALTTALRCEG
jgi:hypothetical protein